MKFEHYQNSIVSGDLLAWSSGTKISAMRFTERLIRAFTMSDFYHVGIAWVVENRIFVIEAVVPQIRIFPLEKSLPVYHIAAHIPWSDEKTKDLLSHVGEEYSIREAIKTFFHRPDEDNQWQCAELVNHFYKDHGIDLVDAYTPTDIVHAMLARSTPSRSISLQLVTR